MEEKRSKYDTDPLDPDFVRRTEEIGTVVVWISREYSLPNWCGFLL